MATDNYTLLITRVLNGDYTLERKFQADVIALARMHGWKVDYTPKTKGVLNLDAGFADLRLMHFERGLIMVRECKIRTRKLNPEQATWRNVALANGWDWQVWRSHEGHHIVKELNGTYDRT